jgi:hypothetical protein
LPVGFSSPIASRALQLVGKGRNLLSIPEPHGSA